MKRRKKLGLAFPDELSKITQAAGSFQGKKIGDEKWEESLIPNYQEAFDVHPSPWRLVILASVFMLIFFGLFLKLFQLQIVEGRENQQRANSNRVQIRLIHAPRGVIYDRNGKILAENNPGFRLKDRFISRDEALALEAKNDPGLAELEVDNIRSYPLGEVTAHVLGYVGQISPQELKEEKYSKYKIGDRIGREGVEQIYEELLKGKDGSEIIEIDASGKKLRTLRRVDPVPGKNLQLSLDADLQQISFEALKKGIRRTQSCCGVVVAEDPGSGEILALISFPSYDSNAFTDPKRNEEVQGFFSDKNSPLLNRVIAGVYPPGSTFKIVSALAGLSSGKISAQTKIEDTGVVSLGPYQFANWYFSQYGKTEGTVDVIKALKRSNDTFFYKVGQMVGEQVLGATAQKLGFGKKLGIDLPGEDQGLIPTDGWKRENIGTGWYPGDTLHMAIGQGFLLTTPLQILGETAFMANSGSLMPPHLATKVTLTDGSLVKTWQFEPKSHDLFSAAHLKLVQDGLAQVTKEGGTGWPFFTFSVATAGKTGTAEFGDPEGKTHAWYTSYGPLDNPTIALTVLIEAGGEGSSVAAPVAKEIYTWYFNTDKKNLQSLETEPVATVSARTLGE